MLSPVIKILLKALFDDLRNNCRLENKIMANKDNRKLLPMTVSSFDNRTECLWKKKTCF